MKASRSEKPIESVDMEELESILEQAKSSLSADQHRKLKAAIETLAYLTSEIEDKRTTIHRLRKLLFGSQSEKTERVFPEETEAAGERPGAEAAQQATEDTEEEAGGKEKRKGHGRNGAAAYVGAETIEVPHQTLSAGADCPTSGCTGKVYRLADPAVIVRIVGQAPLSGKVYKLERLRCNLCLKIFTAKAPEGVGEEKYDASSAAMIALLKYGSGLPFNRLQGLEGRLGIPLPAATQWDIVARVAPLLDPVYRELLRLAAQGEVLHNDDTDATILEFTGQRLQQRIAEGKDSGERTGVYTSGIVSIGQGWRIALFFTGRRHAGENLGELLARRQAELGPPIQMSDALSRNVSKDFETIVANCMSHARRPFVEVAESFPEECRFVLKTLASVFRNDATARREGMSAAERLEFHRRESKRLMASLRLWMYRQLRDRRVEPNSGLGEAIAYMRKHWRKLTRFLFTAGAPLENNLCERMLKKAILHRRNSLFFKTERGARVGDLYMSLIATCQLADANPFDYLIALQRHAEAPAKAPAEWLPWNYGATLERVATQ